MGLRFLQTNQVVQVAFYFSDGLKSTAANLSCFSNRLQREICCNPLPPRGRRLGRGHSPNFSNLSQHPNCPNTSLAACCPLPRERGRVAVGIKGSARKIGCTGCFLFFRRPEINGCKPKLCFKLPEIAKSAATRSLPCGGGLGRGHSPNFGNLSQYPNRPNTSLAACCPLSSSLPRERGWGGCWGLRVLQGKQIVQAAFFLFRRPL